MIKHFDDIKLALAEFAKERDWEQFHSPKNLAMALSVEVAEIVEHFQWLSEKDSAELNEEKRQQVAEEIADTQMYLLMLAEKLDVDIVQSVADKIEKNKQKYPVETAKGNSEKSR